MAMPMLPSITGEKLKKDEKEVTMTTTRCDACGGEDVKEYTEGDIVFGQGQVPCSKCGGTTVITAIYVDIVKK